MTGGWVCLLELTVETVFASSSYYKGAMVKIKCLEDSVHLVIFRTVLHFWIGKRPKSRLLFGSTAWKFNRLSMFCFYFDELLIFTTFMYTKTFWFNQYKLKWIILCEKSTEILYIRKYWTEEIYSVLAPELTAMNW